MTIVPWDGIISLGIVGFPEVILLWTGYGPGLGKERNIAMIYSAEVQHMCSVAKGAYHGPAPIPEEGKWVQAKEIRDISG